MDLKMLEHCTDSWRTNTFTASLFMEAPFLNFYKAIGFHKLEHCPIQEGAWPKFASMQLCNYFSIPLAQPPCTCELSIHRDS